MTLDKLMLKLEVLTEAIEITIRERNSRFLCLVNPAEYVEANKILSALLGEKTEVEEEISIYVTI